MTPDEIRLRRQVGKRVRVQRTVQELTQDELAQRAGVTRNFVSAIERGAQGLDAYWLGLAPGRSGWSCASCSAQKPLLNAIGQIAVALAGQPR